MKYLSLLVLILGVSTTAFGVNVNKTREAKRKYFEVFTSGKYMRFTGAFIENEEGKGSKEDLNVVSFSCHWDDSIKWQKCSGVTLNLGADGTVLLFESPVFSFKRIEHEGKFVLQTSSKFSCMKEYYIVDGIKKEVTFKTFQNPARRNTEFCRKYGNKRAYESKLYSLSNGKLQDKNWKEVK